MIWLKNSTFGVKQQSLTHSVAPEENYRYTASHYKHTIVTQNVSNLNTPHHISIFSETTGLILISQI
jgi:hypothetical protein